MLTLLTAAEITHLVRPAATEPVGALVLMHGRGTDANDLFPLLDLLDPSRRLTGVSPQAPLTPPGHAGHHWYVVQRVGFPEPRSR
jgi:phospholipase/carboxylesterase